MRRSGHLVGGLCALGVPFLPGAAVAQEGGVLLTFGIENRIEISRNAGLAVPAEGTEIANVTLLSFGLVSETALDRLTFGATGGLIARTNDDGSEIDFGRGALSLAYHREVPAAVLDLTADFRTDDADAFDDDLGDIGADGTRSDLSLSARMETGRTSGVGLAFGLAYDRTDYQDTTDPDLFDTEEWRGDVAAILRFSEIATGRVGVRYRHREEDDLGTTVTDETTVFTGLDYAISERADLSVELGYTRTETEEFDIITRERGPEASVRLSYDMPVGTAYALLNLATDADEGQRETFEIGRALETGRDTLSARLGVTHGDLTGTDLIGGLAWTRALPDGSLGVSLERRVSYDADADEQVAESVFTLSLAKNLNETTTLLFDASYELSDAPSERIEQVALDAGFTHALTADWDLSGGVGYTVRNDADGRAESPRLFLAISRDFQFRP